MKLPFKDYFCNSEISNLLQKFLGENLPNVVTCTAHQFSEKKIKNEVTLTERRCLRQRKIYTFIRDPMKEITASELSRKFTISLKK